MRDYESVFLSGNKEQVNIISEELKKLNVNVVLELLENNEKVLNIVLDEGKNNFLIMQEILLEFFNNEIKKIMENKKNIKPTLEGESKKYFKLGESKVAIANLKSSIFSFTHSRYDSIEGIDNIRNAIWGVLGQIINEEFSNFIKNGKFEDEVFNNKYSIDLIKNIIKNKSDIFLSNFIGNIDKNSSLVVFEDEIAENIEIVFKKYFVGTWKHRLLNPEIYNLKNGGQIEVGDKLAKEIIRFDWRNPVMIDGKISTIPDETIPDDLAGLYISSNNAKNLAKFISKMLEKIFKEVGIELVDGCFFMDKDGNRIHSEITPDGLRIKALNDYEKSFDKDLWREGAPKSELTDKWTELYNNLLKRWENN